MRHLLRCASILFVVAVSVTAFGTRPALTEGSLPKSVKSCADVRAYIDADKSMTMDTFKKLMTAAGANLDEGGGTNLDTQCEATAYVKNVMMSQRIFSGAGGNEVRITTKLITDNGTCKLTQIVLDGC